MADQIEKVTPAEIGECLRILHAIKSDPCALDDLSYDTRRQLMELAGRIAHPSREDKRARDKARRRDKRSRVLKADREVRAATSIRIGRKDSVYVPAPRLLEAPAVDPSRPELTTPRGCYICKVEFTRLHHFYDSMCATCAAFNYDKRFQADHFPGALKGQVALLTGGRLKIGYQAALMMLKSGARVIVTTRFPRDSAVRFTREPDFKEWKDRVEVHGLDLRHSPSVEAFAQFVTDTNSRLDILINNAAQTVRRPPAFYAHMLELERQPFSELPADAQALLKAHEDFKARLRERFDGAAADGESWVTEWHGRQKLVAPGVTDSAALSQVPYACDGDPAAETFPEGKLDADLQQLDLRAMNSWRMTLDVVPTAELLEVQLVNSIAPFVLCSKLKPLMMRETNGPRHIINVSAMEGKFSRHTKTDKHPHTNMAKAALNMMTLTSARDYARFGIYMNAVDTGWVTDEDPMALSLRKERDHDFQPPLDIVDGAARVLDPIYAGLPTGKYSWGNFLKDYVPTSW